MSDVLQAGLIESANVRIGIVQLEASWASVLERNDYPHLVAEQLGQLLAAAVLFRSRLKQGSSVNLQIQSEGYLKTLLAQANPSDTLRGLARWDQKLGLNPALADAQLYDNAKLVMTLINSENRYQGIVELTETDLTSCLEQYFSQSEQLQSSLKLVANHKRAAGLLIQKLPDNDQFGEAEENWNRINLLTKTLTDAELLTLSPVELLTKLYAQEDVRVYDEKPVRFDCSCSIKRIDRVLQTMGRESVFELLHEQGKVTVDCEFCSQTYHYDQAQIEALFSAHVMTESHTIN